PSSSPPGRRLSLFSAVSARCISCHGDRRDLHSFPTRRSSDLKDIQEVFQRVYHAGIKVKVITGDNADTTHAIARQAGIINHSPADRKSTRLNSSHVKISYAVFCLKKKKRPLHTQLRIRLTNRA